MVICLLEHQVCLRVQWSRVRLGVSGGSAVEQRRQQVSIPQIERSSDVSCSYVHLTFNSDVEALYVPYLIRLR